MGGLRWKTSVRTVRWIAVTAMVIGLLALAASQALSRGLETHKAHAHAGQAAGRAAPAAPEAVVTVSFTCCQYTAKDVKIQAGDSVQWQGSFAAHPLVSEESLWAMVSAGNSFTHAFTAPGFYRYYCDIHGAPNGVGMSGTVTVVVNSYLPLVVQ